MRVQGQSGGDWFLIPNPKKCLISAFPPPPSPMEYQDVVVDGFAVSSSGGVELTIHWDPPSLENGDIVSYQLRIVSKVTFEDSNDDIVQYLLYTEQFNVSLNLPCRALLQYDLSTGYRCRIYSKYFY